MCARWGAINWARYTIQQYQSMYGIHARTLSPGLQAICGVLTISRHHRPIIIVPWEVVVRLGPILGLACRQLWLLSHDMVPVALVQWGLMGALGSQWRVQGCWHLARAHWWFCCRGPAW